MQPRELHAGVVAYLPLCKPAGLNQSCFLRATIMQPHRTDDPVAWLPGADSLEIDPRCPAQIGTNVQIGDPDNDHWTMLKPS